MSVRRRSWKSKDGTQTTVWVVDITDVHGHRERRQFPGRKEADAFRFSLESKMRAGTFRGDASKFSVKDAADLFLDYCDGRCQRDEQMTRHNYKVMEGHVRNYICPDRKRHEGKPSPARMKVFDGGIGAIRLSQLTARSVGEFRDRLRDAGVTVVTTRKILSTLQQLLQRAVVNDIVGVNVARGIKVIGRRGEGAKKIVPPSKQLVRALFAEANEDFRVQLAFASSTGLRASEQHAIRWRNLDLNVGEANVETRVDAYDEEGPTKTAAGLRTIPLSQSLIMMLKSWKLRCHYKRPDDLVFPNKVGRYMNHRNLVQTYFEPLFAGLEEKHRIDPESYPVAPVRFTWHALRHFAISCWIEAGLTPKTVQTFAGHSSLQVTMDRYGHLFKSEDHKKAMDSIASELLA